MSPFGDNPDEMPRNQPFDDDAIEAILAGTSRDGRFADVAAFVSDVRMSAAAAPNPSPALAAALASGFSTNRVAEPKWRTLRMKIQGLLAGLGVAGKVVLGAGLAAAATTGAGAAGILPGPVQHVVASTVGSVTPFHFPGDDQGQSGTGEATGTTTTTLPSASSSTTAPHETTSTPTTTGETPTVPGAHDGDGTGGVTPPHEPDGGAVTTTTEHHADNGPGAGDGTEPTTTPTTEHHGDGNGAGNGDGDSNNPQSLAIECERAQNPNRIACHWTASTSTDHAKYVLLRITSLSDKGVVVMQSEDALDAVDTSVTGGVGYGYRVISLRADGSVESHSNVWTIMCCGDAGTTTTTTPHHESTTTTTEHHEGTTTTTQH